MVKTTEKVENQTKKNERSIVGRIFGSPYTIIVVLMIFIVALLVYAKVLMRSNKVYTYSGYTKDFSFFGGAIYEGPIVNYFGDSKVLYTGEDETLYDYEVGYYIKYEDGYEPVSIAKSRATTEDGSTKGASLKEIVGGTTFSFTETHKDAKFMSRENMENLENLVFRIVGENEDGEEISYEVPMTIEKITK